MVLDSMENDMFTFKNTFAENKQVKMNVTDPAAPSEFFFVHIEKKATTRL